MDFSTIRAKASQADFYRYMGKIEKIIGTTIQSTGPTCNIGDVCRIYHKVENSHIFAEVVVFNQNKVLLMPYSDIEGVGPGSIVDNTSYNFV